MDMATKGLLLTGIGGFLAVLFCLEAGPAQAALLINPVSARTDNWRIEPGQSIPSNTAAYVDGLLQVTTAGLYTFTYGPSGLVRGATGHGDAINVNEFWVGASRAAAEAAGQLFCTRTLAGHCTASAAGDSFTVNLL